jgi:hypothetical protein
MILDGYDGNQWAVSVCLAAGWFLLSPPWPLAPPHFNFNSLTITYVNFGKIWFLCLYCSFKLRLRLCAVILAMGNGFCYYDELHAMTLLSLVM